MKAPVLYLGVLLTLNGCVTDGNVKTELTFNRDGKPYQPAIRSESERLACITTAKSDLSQLGYARIVKLWEAANPKIKETIDEYSGCKYELNPAEFNQQPLMLSQAVMLLGSEGKAFGKMFLNRRTLLSTIGDHFDFVSREKDFRVPLYRNTAIVEEIAYKFYDDPMVKLAASVYGRIEEGRIPNDAYAILGRLNSSRTTLDFYLRMVEVNKTKIISWDASRLLQTIVFAEIYFNYFQTKMPEDFVKFSKDSAIKNFLKFQLADSEMILKKADQAIKASDNGLLQQDRAKVATASLKKMFKL